MKAKENEILKKNDELLKLKAKVKELETSMPMLQTDNNAVRQRLKHLEDELMVTRDTLSEVEPRLQRLEPELQRLREEREDWMLEKIHLTGELSRLRPLDETLAELSIELDEVMKMQKEREGSPMKSSQNFEASRLSSSQLMSPEKFSPTKTVITSHGVMQESMSIVSLSQTHALWVGLPAIRNLSAPLYDRIRQMAQDLHRKEIECRDIHTTLMSMQRSASLTAKDTDLRISQLSQAQDSAQSLIQSLSDSLRSAEQELSTLRSSKAAIDKIRIILRSYPGGISTIFNAYYNFTGANITGAINNSFSQAEDSFGYDDMANVIGFEREGLEEKKENDIDKVIHQHQVDLN